MSRERERRGRAAERAAAERQQRLIYIGAGAVLGVAALLIVAGLYFTRYLPPRAHVVSVAEQSYQARDVADRAVYLAFFEGGASSISDIARETVNVLLEEEALRQVGPSTVDEVTAADIQRELHIDLGLISEPPAPTAEPEETPAASPTAEGTTTAEPTAEPTPEPTPDPQEFANALTTFLRNSGLDRDEYEAIVEARLYRERLREHFEAELGSSGPQIRLQRIRVSTQLATETIIEELEGGADFGTLADEESVADEDGPGGAIGWTVPELQSEDVQAAIAELEPGEWTEALTAGLFFEVYLLAEAEADREYESTVVDQLVARALDEWLEEAIASLEVDNDLSADEESWINDRVLADVTSRLGG